MLARAALAALVLATTPVMAQDAPLSPTASDPDEMGWMQGFPPPPDKVIDNADQSFVAFPKLRWSACHFRELQPSVGVAPALEVGRIERDLDPAIGEVTFTPWDADDEMTFDEAFEANYTDGLIVLHRGRVVYERYAGCLDRDGARALGMHGAMSVTKSVTGLLAEMLIAEGTLDADAPVTDLIPELAGSAFEDATVRDVLDMRTALDYSENYADPDADIWEYAAAINGLPAPEGYDGPRGVYAYLPTLEAAGEPGGAFDYQTPNADLAGWLVARASGTPLDRLLSERIWQPMGAAREAYFIVDSLGIPSAGGGFNAALEDMARLGQLMLDGGRANGRQVVPEAAVRSIAEGGDRDAFSRSHYDALDGWSYRSLWWHTDTDAYAARGVHGQTIYVDPDADMVIARFATHPVAANAANDPTSLPAYAAVADYLQATAEPSADLVGRMWTVEDVNGRGVIDGGGVDLVFRDDGGLGGRTGCNSLLGRYERDGDRLTIADLGSTKALCPEALMNQERDVLEILSAVTGLRIDETGALILTTEDGRTLTAR
jgi:CubicO group peptidase (beta-lactamase class C family)